MQKSATVLDQIASLQKESAAEGIKRITFEWTKGLITGVNDLEVGNLGGVLDCNGLVAKKREIERTRGLVSFCTTTVTGNPIGIYQHIDLDGDRTLFLLTTSYLYVLTAGAWVVASTGTYVGDEDYKPSFDSWQDNMLFTSFNDTVKLWTAATGAVTALNAFGGVTTKAGCMALFKTRLILGMLDENGTKSPWRVKWSQVGTYSSFTGVGSGFQDLLETPGPVLTMQTILDKLFVFKTDSIWECIYVGSPNVFIIVPVVTGVGLSAKATVDVITGAGGNAEAVIFLGNDDVYIFDGRTATPIGGEFIQKYIFGANSIIDPGYRGRSIGKYIKEDKQYWLSVPLTGLTYPNVTLIYDFLTSSWWKVSLGVPLRCMGESIKSGSLTWNAVLGTWDDSAANWDDAYLAEGAIKVIVGSGTTPTYEIDFASSMVAGSVPSAYLETPDQMYEAETRWLQFSVELKGSDGATLFYSKDEGANWISLGTKAGHASLYKVVDWYMNFTTEKTRFKLELGSNTTAIRKNKGFITLRTV